MISLDGSGRGRRLEGRRRLALEIRSGAPPPAARQRRTPWHLGLAVRAHLPLRLQRPAAARARVLELAHAVRAAQEVLLHVLLAVRADEVAALLQPRLRRLHLQLALADVV